MTSETDYRDAMVQMAGDELEKLRDQNRRLRAALGSIYQHALRLTGREAVQALVDSGQLKNEDLIL